MYVERTVMLSRAVSDGVCPAQVEIGASVTQHNWRPRGGRAAAAVADRCVLQSAMRGRRHPATSAQNSRHLGDHAPAHQLAPTTSHGGSCRRISDAERASLYQREPIMLSGSPVEIALSRQNPGRRAHTQHNRALNIQPGVTVSDHRALQRPSRDVVTVGHPVPLWRSALRIPRGLGCPVACAPSPCGRLSRPPRRGVTTMSTP